MQGVVLAAGEGTRLRPLTTDRPKGLVTVAGRPLLAYPFDALAAAGVSEAVVVIGYRGDDIVDRFGDEYRDLSLSYVRQEPRDGLATAVLAAADRLDGPFVVANGDNVLEADLGAVVDRHRAADATATLLVQRVDPATAADTGVVDLDDDGAPVGVVEKPTAPPSTLALTGFFVFDPVVLHACRLVTPSDRGEHELADAIDLLLAADHSVELHRLDGWRVNVNTPEDVSAATDRLE